MYNIIVFDPTVSDSKSKVRGVGRYLQLLKENFDGKFEFISSIENCLPAGKAGKLKIENSVFINPFLNLTQYPLIMRRVVKKQIAVIHDLIPLKYPDHFPIGLKGKLNVFLNKLALRNYDLVVTDSEASKRDIISILKINPEKIKVIYPCLPKAFDNLESKIHNSELNSKSRIINSKFNSEFSILNSKFCLYVGDATWNKNLVNMAKAIKIANIKCMFVGKVFENLTLDTGNLKLDKETRNLMLENRASNIKPQNPVSNIKHQASKFNNPWQKEFAQFIKETKNDERFIFPGFVSDNDLIKLYQQARVNLLLSRDEGFGFSPLEAGIFNCPSIVSNISVLKEIVGKDNALFVDPNDPTQIADAIKKLFSDNTLHQQLGSKAQERSKYFNPNMFNNSWKSCLKSV